MASRDGTASLADYRGKAPLLLALFRGLYCAFCRRHMAQLGVTTERLRDAGVDVLAVTATPAERARLYLRHRPMKVAIAADPDQATHRAYGLVSPLERGMSPGALEAFLRDKYRAIAGDHGVRLRDDTPLDEILATANRLDGYEVTRDDAVHGASLTGQFLIDIDGTLRWMNLEEATPAGLGGFPSDTELLAVAGRLAR